MHNNLFGTKELSVDEEARLKDFFDTTLNPREWMAKFGHNIVLGDFRIFKIRDKIFEEWIHLAFDALYNEGLDNLWEEFLSEDKIRILRDKYNNL